MFLTRTFKSCLFRRGKNISGSIVHVNNVYEGKRNQSTISPLLNDFLQYSSSCNITTSVQFCMEEFHSMTGLGWGTTFVASAFLLRAISLLPHFYAEKLYADNIHYKNGVHQKCIQNISERFKVETELDNGRLKLKTDDKRIKTIAEKYIEENTKSVIFGKKLSSYRILSLKICTVPMWFFSSFAVKNIIFGSFNPDISGCLWISNLMLPDPYLIMPVAVGLLGYLNMYSQKLIFPDDNRITTRVRDTILALTIIISVKYMMDLPTYFSLYWMSISISGILELAIIRHPKLKRYFGIRKLPTDSKYPLVNLFNINNIKRQG